MLDTKNLTLGLLIVVSLLGIITLNKDLVGNSIIENNLEDLNLDVKDGVINLNSLTLKQKIGQMVFTLGKVENKELYKKMNIGGIYFWQRDDEEVYKTEIDYFQENMEIPFLVGIDLEGCWNPFNSFQDFPKFNDIESSSDAYKVGESQGKLLRKLGFNINFSPVVDRDDTIWGCRNFKEDIEERSASYVRGLQGQGIIATAKHYPGKTLVGKDPHKEVGFTTIEEDDLKPFEWSINNGVKAVMINHLITKGEINSEFKPSVVSGNVIKTLKKDFDGLVLTDEVRMNGLSDFYSDENRMYIDLVNAGNDIVLDFKSEPWHLFKIVNIIYNGVQNGEISEERINDAVVKILKSKGFKVIKRNL